MFILLALHAYTDTDSCKYSFDLRVIIIDKTNMNDPTKREAFWAYNLDTFVPKGLNVRDFG
jgi:hypothetical protein